MELSIRTEGAFTCLCMRHIGAYPSIGASFEKLYEWIQTHSITPGLALAIYHDEPGLTPEAELRSDAAIVIQDRPAVELKTDNLVAGDVHILEIPAATYAVVTHRGSYDQLARVWQDMMRTMADQGLQMAPGFCFEKYLNDCTQVPEDQLLTEICEPIVANA